MNLAELIDRAIEPFAPKLAYSRAAWRNATSAVRQYDAAAPSRLTQGWRRTGNSANTEIARGLKGLRNGAHELVRNNKTADAAARQFTAHVVGNGITITMHHPDPAVRDRAQEEWDDWAESEVDGRNDFYGVQKLDCRTWFVGGEALNVWSSRHGYSDRVRVYEGHFLDEDKNDDNTVQGVQFNQYNERLNYWLFDKHPGDTGWKGQSRPFAAENIDHIFEELRAGQVRGVSMLASSMLDIKDHGELKEAIMMKKKVQACLSVIITPGEGSGAPGPFSQLQENPSGGPLIENLVPGSILHGRAGDQVTAIEPSADGDSVDFRTKELAGIGAVTVPYHLLTGDVSQANYSSLRAAMLGFWALLDDWQDNVMLPFVMKPAFKRRMYALYLKTGDKRYLQVKPEYAMPVRRFIDPIKDVAGEVAEIRAGFKTQAKALAERGTTVSQFVKAKASEQKQFDDAGVVIETDVRRVTDSGILQAAVGYIAPTGDKSGAKATPKP